MIDLAASSPSLLANGQGIWIHHQEQIRFSASSKRSYSLFLAHIYSITVNILNLKQNFFIHSTWTHYYIDRLRLVGRVHVVVVKLQGRLRL